MKCRSLMDKIYDSWGEEELSLSCKVRISVHLFFCRRCSCEVKKFQIVQKSLTADFFQEGLSFESGIESNIMEKIYLETPAWEETESSTGVSFRSWVITGFVILFSLSTMFFGMDFISLAAVHGSSYLLPIGISIGCIVTAYGAVFIGSHLDELSERFGLH